MKNFFKLLLIAFSFFIPVFADAIGIDYEHAINNSHTVIENPTKYNESVFTNKLDSSEYFITCANSRKTELSATQSGKNSFGFNSCDKTASQNKLTQQIFTTCYNKFFYGISHKISSCLTNEICARAP